MNGLLGHVINMNFTSHLAMMEASLLWKLEEYQLENGSFKGFIHAIHTSHIQLADTFRSRGVFLKGKIPKNSYVIAAIGSNGLLTHNGVPLGTDELIVLDDEDEIDYTAATSAEIVTFVVEKEFFESAFQSYFNKAFDYDKVNKRIQMKKYSGIRLRSKIVETLTDLMEQNGRVKNDPEFHDEAEEAILQILFNSMDLMRQPKKVLESDKYANEMREYMEKNYNEHLIMEEIYKSEKFCPKTVRSGFKRLFGFSPKQYLTQYRLGRVHYDLLKADSSSTNVGHIAFEHGFSHMSRFSQQYESMYGLKPYTTLKNHLFS